MKISTNQVIKFINRFKELYPTETEVMFTSGLCYWFAFILSEQFKGKIKYSQVENHFVCEINRHLYDIRGCVDKEYKKAELFYWEDYADWDLLDYNRVIKYCKNLEQ